VTRRLLVVATAPDPSDELLERLSREAGEDVEVAVVAPTSDLSPLEWLGGEEDRAIESARHRAAEAAAAALTAGTNSPVKKVAATFVGDPDPVMAVADALRQFPADELIVVTRPSDQATWLEKRALTKLDRFGLPVTHLVDDDAAPPAPRSSILTRADEDLAFWGIRNVVVVLLVVAILLIGVSFLVYYSVR
jgi:hypothetical protein